MDTKLKICSMGLAIALWGINPAYSSDIQIEKDGKGNYHPVAVDAEDANQTESLKLADESAVDTEWANYRGAIDTEWA